MGLKNIIAGAAVAVAISAKKLLEGLNPEQAAAVKFGEGPILVAAVAGAGKTRALVHRVAYLVTQRKVDPKAILAVTFSKAGADEMNNRLEKMVPKSGARIGTFHSVALEILKNEVEGVIGWEKCGDERYKFCVKDAAGYRELNWKSCDINMTCSYIGFCKANMARPYSDEAIAIARERYYYQYGPRKADPEMLNRVYERAEEIRRDREMLTFDDMMIDAAELLQNNENIRRRWARRWDWVLQDEAQDQNKVQLVLGELLARDHRNYLLVGDPAQAIYSWRGAMPSMLLSFEERWGADVVQMSRNYRCGQAIIDTANRMLDSMDPSTRLDMHMVCEKGTEGKVLCRQYSNLDDEAAAMASEIAELLEDGTEPKDCAILYRTNAQSRAPEEALISRRIPYMVVGGTNFYNRKEVKDLLAYLRIAEGRGTLDDVRRCINAPFRFLGKAFVEKVTKIATVARRSAKKQGKNVHWPSVVREACGSAHVQQRQKNSAREWADLLTDSTDRIREQKKAVEGTEAWDAGKPVNILEDIVLATKYTDWLVKDEGEETTENSRVSNVRELIRASRRFPTVSELLDYIDTLNEASKGSRSKGKKPNKVILTTLHRSKGLEWENVFMAGCNEYILPHARSEDLDEERRLFYVGVTRAKERLSVSCVSEIAVGDRLRVAEASPFIYEAGLEPVFMVRNEEEPEIPELQLKDNAIKVVSDGPLFDDFDDDDFDDDDFDEDSDPRPNAPFLR